MRNPYFSLLATAWKYARTQRRRFLLVYSMFAGSTLVIACTPILYGWFIDQLQVQGTDVFRTGWIYAALFVGLKLVEWIFHGPARVMERGLAFVVGRNFMEELYTKILHLPTSWHQNHHSGSTLNKLRKAHEALRDFFQNGFVYFYTFGKFFFSFGAMLVFSPLFGSIGVALGAVTILIIRQFDKPFIKTLQEVNTREHALASNLSDSLSNIITVITLKLEKRIRSTAMRKLLSVYPPFRQNIIINEWKWFTAQMMIAIIYGITTMGYLYQHWQPGQPFLIGGLVILLGYVNQFTSVFNDVAAHYSQIVRYYTEVQNIGEIEKAYDTDHRVENDKRLPENWSTLDIQNLSFHRGKSLSLPRPTGISNLSMRIERGQRIALIGESGSGKSTLLALLRGLYHPQEKSLLIDGREPGDFESISNAVTLLPQDPEIFENSVLYNITLGLPFSEEDIAHVCDVSQFSSVLRHLSKGLHTNIMEKGVNLSGGQKQRLALARGILAARDSDIILLDEPTSSIDPRTEQIIYKKFFKAFRGKTIISSLHRLHLLPKFDYVYILKDGVVVDKGTPADLEHYSLIYKELREHVEKEDREQAKDPSANHDVKRA